MTNQTLHIRLRLFGGDVVEVASLSGLPSETLRRHCEWIAEKSSEGRPIQIGTDRWIPGARVQEVYIHYPEEA